MKSFGIDFGTTNSVVATYDGLNKEVLPFLYKDGLPHPSIIWYTGDKVNVGREAKKEFNKYVNEPGHAFIRSIKANLGNNQELPVFGRLVPAYEVASEIFKHLKRHAKETYSSNLDQAVVTIPVKFNGHQRADIRKAAQLAGIHVKNFIHEPFAGIIGYLNSIDQLNFQMFNRKNILVFDWGGGTLDVTLVRYEDGKLYEISTGGLENRAGDYFDELIQQQIVSQFIDRYKLNPALLQLHPRIKDRLAEQAEINKIALSDDQTVKFPMARFFEIDGQSISLNETLKRDTFERLIKLTVQEAIKIIDQTLRIAGIGYEQVSLALLIGGTSKIPLVRREVQKLFGSRAVEVENSNTVIAEGAAIISQNNWTPYLVRPIAVQMADNSYYTVFDNGTSLLPHVANKEVSFFVTDNRDGEARLILAEGISDFKATKEIVNIKVSNKIDSRYLEKILTNFSVTEDLVLRVRAHGSITGDISTKDIYDLCYGLRVS